MAEMTVRVTKSKAMDTMPTLRKNICELLNNLHKVHIHIGLASFFVYIYAWREEKEDKEAVERFLTGTFLPLKKP